MGIAPTRLALVILVATGVVIAHRGTAMLPLAAVAAVLGVCCLAWPERMPRAVGRGVSAYRRVRWVAARPVGRHPWLTACVLFFVVATALALPWRRGLASLGVLPWHDSESCLLEARLIAEGRLSRPALEHADFFRTIHVLVTPIYCSKYPPGYPAVMAAGLLAGHVAWVPPILVGLAVAATWLFGIRLLGAWRALLAALFVATSPMAVQFGTVHLSSTLSLLLGVPIVGLWLRSVGAHRQDACTTNAENLRSSRRILWHRRLGGGDTGETPVPQFGCGRRPRCATTEKPGRLGVTVGLLLSGLLLTRPFDAAALGFVLCAGHLAVCGVRSRAAWRWIAFAIVGGIPGVVGTLAYHHATTGDWKRSPYLIYEAQQSYTGQFIFEDVRPAADLDERPVNVRRLAQEFTAPAHRRHTLARLPITIAVRLGELFRDLGAGMLLAPVLALPLAWRVRRARPLVGVSAAYFACYLLYAFDYARYMAPVAAGLAWALVAALHGLRRVSAAHRRVTHPLLESLLVVLLLVGCVSEGRKLAMLELDPASQRFHAALATLPAGRKLVFVRYAPDHWPHREFVYNAPDLERAECVFAHDLGAGRNRELLDAYPERSAFLYDEKSGKMRQLEGQWRD